MLMKVVLSIFWYRLLSSLGLIYQTMHGMKALPGHALHSLLESGDAFKSAVSDMFAQTPTLGPQSDDSLVECTQASPG